MKRYVLIMLFSFLTLGCSSLGGQAARSVRVTKPVTGDLEAQFLASGRVAAPSLDIASETSGRINSLKVDEAVEVTEGQVVAVVDDTEARSEITRLEAAIAAARSYQQESLYRVELEQSRLAKEQSGARAQQSKATWQLRAAARGATSQELRSAEAAVDEAKVRVEQARSKKERLETLFAQDIASKAAVEEAKSLEEIAIAGRTRAVQSLQLLKAGPPKEEIEMARADVQAADAQLDYAEDGSAQLSLLRQQLRSKELELARLEADLAAAQVRVSKSRLTSPVKGTISRVLRRQGELVQAGTPVLNVMSSESMWVEISLTEEEAAHADRGQNVVVTFPSVPSSSLTGKIKELAPSLEGIPGVPGNTRFLKARIELDSEPDFLRPGLEAQVEGKKQLASSALLIPRSCLIETEGKHFVALVANGKVSRREVVLGAITASHAEVSEGLTADDFIVSSQPEQVAEGEKVTSLD